MAGILLRFTADHAASASSSLEKTVQDCCPEEPSAPLRAQKYSFLHLAQQMESLLISLEQEILTMFSPRESLPQAVFSLL
jgi:hypothetical protein